jgi:mRNA-degrading endonuclease RelE of RelBE toxin-antitoxin system
MEFFIQTHPLFNEQLEELSQDAKKILDKKIQLLKFNPFRNKSLKGYNLMLFRIRFEDNRKEKRLVYHVAQPNVRLLCIIDRDKDYKDLEDYLRRLGYY